MEDITHQRHKKHKFFCHVNPLEFQYDDVQQQLPSLSSPVRVAIEIRYKLKRCHGHISEHHQAQSARIFDRSEENREATCQLLLSELECVSLSFALLSPELSRLGVRRGRQKGIVKRLVNCAHKVEKTLLELDDNCYRKVVLVPIEVELVRFRSKWFCDDCPRKSAIKMMMKGFRIQDNHHDHDHDDHHEGHNCGVCLEAFGVGKTAVRVPCLHEFHAKCILTWLLENSSCPLCRFHMALPLIM